MTLLRPRGGDRKRLKCTRLEETAAEMRSRGDAIATPAARAQRKRRREEKEPPKLPKLTLAQISEHVMTLAALAEFEVNPRQYRRPDQEYEGRIPPNMEPKDL